MGKPAQTVLVLAGWALILLLMSACGLAPTESLGVDDEVTTSTLTDLHDIQQLQRAFNAAHGSPRLILLLSPT